MTFGKVMGGGLPAAAFGGRAEIMDRLAPAGPVYQAGTLSGNPLATAAGLATLRACTPEVYARVDEAAAAVAQARQRTRCRPRGCRSGCSRRAACSPCSSGTEQPVRDFGEARGQSVPAYAAFFHAMLDGGRLPAAVAVRGVVPVRGARRRGGAAGSPPRCPPRPRAAVALG